MLKSEMVDVKKQLSELGSLVRHLLNSGGGEVESAFEARLAESARSQYLRDRETVGGVRVEAAQIAEASGYENNDSKSEEPGKKDEDPEIDTQGSRPDEDEVNRGEGPEGIEEVEHSANALASYLRVHSTSATHQTRIAHLLLAQPTTRILLLSSGAHS